jgi:AraC family transcriptional regulator of arabinose operon
MEESSSPMPRRERLSSSAARSTAIRHFIQGRHMQRIRLEDLAEHLHISESRAGHAVREACGKSFVELLVEARLHTAAELLRYTNLSVLEISMRSGFNDLSHFHETFRARFKATPHRFRKREQERRFGANATI